MKAILNKDKCFGCGGCVSAMSEIFDFDDDQKAKVVADEIEDKDLQDKLKTFVDNNYCPGDAIRYE